MDKRVFMVDFVLDDDVVIIMFVVKLILGMCGLGNVNWFGKLIYYVIVLEIGEIFGRVGMK